MTEGITKGAVGFTMGLLTVLAYQRITEDQIVVQSRLDPSTVISTWKAGYKDALRTNPASWELEQTCLEVWANKQPQ
jgi:hypothetical protein